MEFWTPAPVKAEGLAEVVMVPFDVAETASVVLAVVATAIVVPAGVEVAVPTTRAAAVVLAPVMV